MKQILLILTILATLSCKAQSPIVSLKDFKNVEITDGIYYKDLDGDLDNYLGTWTYTNGTTSLTITFQKKEQVSLGEWFEDILVAEYKYIENGVEVINTLPLLGASEDNVYNYNITGNTIIYRKQFVECDDCSLLERRIKLDFTDPERSYLINAMSIRYKNDNGVEKIEMHLKDDDSIVLPYEDAPTETRVPYGAYTLIKE